jgi:hypothetical protein
MSRTVLNALRQARKPFPAYEIALLFMASRGLAAADKPLLRVIHKRVGACLRNYRGKGLVRASEGPGRVVLWELARWKATKYSRGNRFRREASLERVPTAPDDIQTARYLA